MAITEQQFNSPGFVYTWSELSTGMIYCGSRKGTPDDGYICSSKTLLPKIKANPSDYVRKLEYVGIWGLAIGLEEAINKQLIKDLDTTYNRTAGKAIVNAVHPMKDKNHRDDTKEKLRAYNLGRHDGAAHEQFKGYIIATNIETGEQRKFAGNKELNAAGFQHENVYKCVNGKRAKHKGHTFVREAL